MRLHLAAVMVVLLFLPTVGQKHGEPANKKDTNAQQSNNPTITVVNAAPTKHDEKQPNTQSGEWPPLWDIYWPTAGLVILGAVGTVIAICTLRDLKRQTDAAVDAARAAKINAEAIINSERAWIVAELKPEAFKAREGAQWWKYKGKTQTLLTVQEILHGEHLYHSLFVTNIGRTPAQLLSFSLNYTCLPEGVTDLDPKVTPDYSQLHEFINLLASNAGIEILARIDVSTLISKSRDEIQGLKKTAVFHGWVKYQNIFGLPKECKSDFCYVYTVSEERLSNVGRHTRYS